MEHVLALQRRFSDENLNQIGLAQLASELGHALARGRLSGGAAAQLSHDAVRARRRFPKQGADNGYAHALEDILAAVAAALVDAQEREDVVAEVRQNPTYAHIVRQLEASPAGPNDLALALDGVPNNGKITRALQQLEGLELIEPASGSNQRARPRRLTARGYGVARALNDELGPAIETAQARAIALRTATRVLLMFQLARRCREVSVRELTSSFGTSAANESFVRDIAFLGERHGFLDVSEDGTCRWGREQLSITEWLKHVVPDKLAAAFAEVPPGYVLVTDHVDAWRDVLSHPSFAGVGDICSPTLAWQLSLAPENLAFVFDDPTLGHSVLRDRSGPIPASYVARPDGDSARLVRGVG